MISMNENLQDWERELLTLADDSTPVRDVTADEDASMDDAPEFFTKILGWAVTVDKDGGGTLGKAYEGTWTVTVMNGPVFEVDNEVLHMGTPKTHAQVARLAYEFAAERCDGGE